MMAYGSSGGKNPDKMRTQKGTMGAGSGGAMGRGTMGSGSGGGGVKGAMGKNQKTGNGQGQGGGGNAHPHPPSSKNAASGDSRPMHTNKSGMSSGK